MEGDAGSGQLNPTPPPPGDDAEPSVAGDLLTDVTAEVDENGPPDGAPDDGAPENGGPEDGGPEDGGQPASGLRMGRVAVAVILAGLLVAAGAGLALWFGARSAAATRSEGAALEAAKDCVAATQAPDTKAMTASATKIIDCTTGDFGAQAKIFSSMLVDAYQTAKAQLQVTDIRAAVERHNPDGSMDVLVALRVKLSNIEQQGQEHGYRLRARMEPVDGTFKIARLDQVSR